MQFSADLNVLIWAAISIGFFHTLFGPDHYVPFVAMSHAGRWTWRKTIVVTLLCGFGHVGSSILLGFIGIALGIVVMKLETVESIRGDLAGWALLGFGLVYFVWGLVHARRHVLGQPHSHGPRLLLPRIDRPEGASEPSPATQPAEVVQSSQSAGDQDSLQPYAAPRTSSVLRDDAATEKSSETPSPNRLSPWALAVIFVLGPCEPLIPLLMYPAAKANAWGALFVAGIFGLVTLLTMTVAVIAMRLGINAVRLGNLHAYSHAFAGFAVFASGLAIQLGL